MKTANVEYFYTKCNQVLGTNYTANDWGGTDNSIKPLNIEWIAEAAQKVYQKIHNPKTGCRLFLSSRFNSTVSKLVLNEEVVNSVIDYLSKLNKPCDNDCACATDRNCNCVCFSTYASNCGYMGNCADSECTCNCGTTYAACACNCNCNCASTDCGNNTECQCDCDPYDCNCDMVPNCPPIPARPMTQNCVCQQGSNCPCACACYVAPPPPPQHSQSGPGHSQGGGGHSQSDSHKNSIAGAHSNTGIIHNEGHKNGTAVHTNITPGHSQSSNCSNCSHSQSSPHSQHAAGSTGC
jgi:hypothetical protein